MPAKFRTCIVCGKSFKPIQVNSKACSNSCRKTRAIAQRRNWHRKHKPKMQAYWTEYHLKRRAKRNAASLARYYAKVSAR